jgi:hypothetical protein
MIWVKQRKQGIPAVLELVGQIKDDDIAFLRQVYTIIKRHIKK